MLPRFALQLLLTAAALAAGPLALRAAPVDPLESCRAWIQSRAWELQEAGPGARIVSPGAACYDGVIEPGALEPLHEWVDAAGEDAPLVLVVRSRGGDSETALALAEKLQARDARLHVLEVCASSCANYFYAGVRQRHVMGPALVLFHGGFSPRNRDRALAMLEAHLSGPQGAPVTDPEGNRRSMREALDGAQARQDALYDRIGVSAQVVHGFDTLDAKTIEDLRCGGGSQLPRRFVYFDAAQMQRLGIAAVSGRPEQRPPYVNAAIAALDPRFIACLAPESFVAALP